MNLFSLIHKESEALKDIVDKTSCRGGEALTSISYPVDDAFVKPYVTRLPSRRPTAMYTRRPPG